MKPNNNNNMWQQLRNFIYPQSFPGSVGLPVQIYQKPIPSHFITNYPTPNSLLVAMGLIEGKIVFGYSITTLEAALFVQFLHIYAPSSAICRRLPLHTCRMHLLLKLSSAPRLLNNASI